MHFGINHLGHFLLTLLLMDLLKANAPSRIVNVASNAHMMTGSLQFKHLPNYNDGANYGGSAMNAYSQSKQCNILFTYELQKRLSGTGVTAIVVHPGVIRTSLWQHVNPTTLCICKCPTDGAKPVLYASTSSRFTARPNAKSMTESLEKTAEFRDISTSQDRMYIPCCCCTIPASTIPESYVLETQTRLWELSMRYVRYGTSENIDEIQNVLRQVEDLPPNRSISEHIPSILRLGLPAFGLCPLCWCCA